MIALDSTVVIHLMRRDPTVRLNFARARSAGTLMHLSAIVVEELTFGIAHHRFPERERAYYEEIARDMVVVPFEPADADVGGHARAALAARGKPPPYADFLIGAHALARGHTLVTANTRDFQNIPGLQLLDWTKPPQTQDSSHA